MKQQGQTISKPAFRVVVNRSGDITRDVEFPCRADAEDLFRHVLSDFCRDHSSPGDDVASIISSCVRNGVFVSKQFGFSISLTAAA